MEDYRDDILNDAKLILGISDTSSDSLLAVYVFDAVSYIKSFCHLEVMPLQLCGIAANMTAGMYRRNKNGDDISLVKEGDREIGYCALSEFMEVYSERLKPFINMAARLPSEVNAGV